MSGHNFFKFVIICVYAQYLINKQQQQETHVGVYYVCSMVAVTEEKNKNFLLY